MPVRRTPTTLLFTPDAVIGRVAQILVGKRPDKLAVIRELQAVVAARLVAPEYNLIYTNLMHHYRAEGYLDLRIDAPNISPVEIEIFELTCNRFLEIAHDIEMEAYEVRLPSARKEIQESLSFVRFYAGVFALARGDENVAEGHFRLAGDYWDAKSKDVADQIIGDVPRAEAMLKIRYARIKAILSGRPIPQVVSDAPKAPPPPPASSSRAQVRPQRPPIREVVIGEEDRLRRTAGSGRPSRRATPSDEEPGEKKLQPVDRSHDRPLIIEPQKLVDEAKALVVLPDKQGAKEQAAEYKRQAETLNLQRNYLAAIYAALEAIKLRPVYQQASAILRGAVGSIYQNDLFEKVDAFRGIEFAEALLIIKPDEAQAIVRIAHYLGRLRRVSDADKALVRARAATRDSRILAYADLVEARIRFYAEEYDKALAIIVRFNREHPFFRDSLVLRFRAYTELKQYAEGLAFLDSIKGLQGILAQNFQHENRGVFLRLRGNETKSVEDLREAYVCYQRAYQIVSGRPGDKFGSIYEQKKSDIAREIRAMGGNVPDVSQLQDEASIPQRLQRATAPGESPVTPARPRVVRDIRRELGMSPVVRKEAAQPTPEPSLDTLPEMPPEPSSPVLKPVSAALPVPTPMLLPMPAPTPEPLLTPVPSVGAVEQMRLRVESEFAEQRLALASEKAEIAAARLAITQEREALERAKEEHALQVEELAADREAFDGGKLAVAEELAALEAGLQEREAALDEREGQLERTVQRRHERQAAELEKREAAANSLGTWLDGLAAHHETDFRLMGALQGVIVTALTDAVAGRFDDAVITLRPLREGFPGSEIPVAARAAIEELRRLTAENRALRQQPTSIKSAATPASPGGSVLPELAAVQAELETAKERLAALQAELAEAAMGLQTEKSVSAGLRAKNEALLQTAAALTARLKAAKPVTETETPRVQLQPNLAFETVWNRIARYTPEVLAQQNPLIRQLFTYEQKTKRSAIPMATVIDRRRRIFAIIINDLIAEKTPTTTRIQAVDKDAFNNGYINQAFRAFPTFAEHIAAAQAILELMRAETR